MTITIFNKSKKKKILREWLLPDCLMKYDNDIIFYSTYFFQKEDASDRDVILKTEKNKDFNRKNVHISNVIISQLAWGHFCTIWTH